MKDPLYPNGKADDVVNVELTRKDIAIIKAVLGQTNGSILNSVWIKFKNLTNFKFLPLHIDISPHQNDIETALKEYFAPRKPTEKELRQAKIAELKQTIAQLEALDDHQDR